MLTFEQKQAIINRVRKENPWLLSQNQAEIVKQTKRYLRNTFIRQKERLKVEMLKKRRITVVW